MGSHAKSLLPDRALALLRLLPARSANFWFEIHYGDDYSKRCAYARPFAGRYIYDGISCAADYAAVGRWRR